MDEDVRTFLKRFTAEELVDKGALSTHAGTEYQLNNRNVEPLIELMVNHSISRLEATERNWYLTSDREFGNPSAGEVKSGKLTDLSQIGLVFNDQNPHINPFFKSSTGSDSAGDMTNGNQGGSEDSVKITNGLERDLQRALRISINQLEPGLRIIDNGSELIVEAGRIDITAEYEKGQLVVIELKAGTAPTDSITQLLAYMGTIENPEGKPIRGILVAGDFPQRVVYAAKAVPNLSSKSYSFQFEFIDH